MSNNDFLEKIDEDNNELSKLHNQLLKWQQQIIN